MAIPGSLRGRGGGDYGFDDGVTLLVLDRAKIEAMNLPGGMTYRWTHTLVREVEVAAKGLLVPGYGYVTGELQRSVGSSVTPVPGGVVGSVRASSHKAIWVHEGTRAHYIEARNPAKFLHFRNRAGVRVRAKYVNHPGAKAHPFLRDAMTGILAARGITRG